ncbi:MAG: VanW family protein [Candidatus Promineifilaceae bacterium]
MQATLDQPRLPTAARKLGWFFVAPLTAVALLAICAALVAGAYQTRHQGRIYTGVQVWGVDLSALTKEEARHALSQAAVFPGDETIVLREPASGESWQRSTADLGVAIDVERTVDAAYQVGRGGQPAERAAAIFQAWYYGRPLAPVIVFDQAQFDQALAAIGAEVNQAPADASLNFTGSDVSFEGGQTGRALDVEETRQRLLAAVNSMQPAEVELLVHQTFPLVSDVSATAEQIRNIMAAPMTLYLDEPIAGLDLQPVSVPPEELVKWIRVRPANGDPAGAPELFLDENAIRAWLTTFEGPLRRWPLPARFYFDDNTRELVLVEPHVNGRELDVDATVARFVEQVMTNDRSMPFLMKEVVPAVHAGATAQELGITELVSEATTYFYGSSAARKHNIARAAAQFYGIVIAPGQEFSFNQYLGDVSAAAGYDQGLIIVGGRTIKGVGGGVCQVSTTAFQAAFWAGFPISERWAHGYRVGYYDDGAGPGMDATVFSPLVDFRFINDTPHHLIIENYYSEASSSLTFKIYSTSMGRTVTKEGPYTQNEVPPKPDVYELNPELAAGEIEQVDWAVEGSDVTVIRQVFNLNNELIREDIFVSQYIPWQNVYQYGPGTELPTPEPEGTPPAEATPDPAATPAATPG